jgi:hypothetical protein
MPTPHSVHEARQQRFQELVRPLLQHLCEEYHPHVAVMITPTSAVLYEGMLSTGEVLDFVRD